jgi:hypothetical protein
MPDMDGQHKSRGGPLYWLGRRSRRFWIITGVMTPALYFASFGPACWWLSSETESGLFLSAPTAYAPIGAVASLAREHGWSRIDNLVNWYATVGAKGRIVFCGGDLFVAD